jgi:hypothetical protein
MLPTLARPAAFQMTKPLARVVRNCHASFHVSHVESLRSSGLANAHEALFPVWANGAKHEISANFQTAIE